MTLPLTTTAVTISRATDNVDPYEDQLYTIVASGVRGVVSGSGGAGLDVGGAQQILTGKLFLDQGADLRKADLVTDETSDEVWRVLWVRKRYELGLGHVVAGIELTEGAVDGS